MREQSRERIIQAALKLFAHKGFYSTSIADIAKEAGVAKGLIYNYFESKEALMEGVIMHIFEVGANILGEMQKLETAFGQFEFLINLSFDYIRKNFDLTKIMTQVLLQIDDFPNLRETLMGRYTALMPAWIYLFEQLNYPDPRGEALMLGAMLDGIGINYLSLRNDDLLSEHEAIIRRRYLDPHHP